MELVGQPFGQPVLLHRPGVVERDPARVADGDDALPAVAGVRRPVHESLRLEASHDRSHGLRPCSLSPRELRDGLRAAGLEPEQRRLLRPGQIARTGRGPQPPDEPDGHGPKLSCHRGLVDSVRVAVSARLLIVSGSHVLIVPQTAPRPPPTIYEAYLRS